MSNSRVEFKERAVIIDGRKTQIIAGAMHYFRVPREYWRDRMEKAVQLGLNCIETYMCWNLHERKDAEVRPFAEAFGHGLCEVNATTGSLTCLVGK